MARERNAFVLFGMVLVTLLSGCKPQPRAVTKNLLLLEARLERTHSGKTEIVSKVRFIAESDASASVFLPCGDELGIGIAFLPEVSAEGQIVLSRANYFSKFFAEDIWGDYKDWDHRFWHSTGGAETTLQLNIGEDVVFAQGSMSTKSNNEVSYKVFVRFEKTVDRSDMRHTKSGLLVVDGEPLHQINVAIPEIMSAGVELGAMINKKANRD